MYLKYSALALSYSLLASPPRLTKPNKYSQDELRLMKTQDVKYLVMKERTEAEVRAERGTKGTEVRARGGTEGTEGAKG